MNADYPLPDPSWDYYEIYVDCQESAQQLQKLIRFMSQAENGTLDTDKQIKELLDAIGQRLNQARRKMDS